MALSLDVYAFGNVDALHGIFNALAAIGASDNYLGMVRVGIVVGFITVLVLMAISVDNLRRGFHWFLSVTVITTVMLAPVANVTISDRLGYQPAVVVANVPWALAAMANLKTAIGAALTELLETAFQSIPAANRALPAELSYLNHGMMFGARLVRRFGEAEATNAYDRSDLVQYIISCVQPESNRGLSAQTLRTSTDLATLLANTNPAFSATYHDPANGWAAVTDTCPKVWRQLSARLAAIATAAVRRVAGLSWPALYAADPATATTEAENGSAAMFVKSLLAGAGTTASDLMVQNILVNALTDAAAVHSAMLGDSAMLMYSAMRSQAVQQMNAGNLVQGSLAEEALPLVRNIAEALLYAMFPVLCVLLVASEGRAAGLVFKSYAYMLLWVELWPPMFAVVNYLGTLELSKSLAAAGMLDGGGSGLALGNALGIYSASVSALGVTSWVVGFVPVIAAAVLFGADRLMSITGAVAGGVSAAQAEATSATRGNLSAGNVSFGQQQLATYRSEPAMLRTESAGGTLVTDLRAGQSVSQYRNASLPVSTRVIATAGEGVAKQAAIATELAERESDAYGRSLDAAYATATSAVRRASKTSARSQAWDVSTLTSSGLSASEEKGLARQIAKEASIVDASSVDKAVSLALTQSTAAKAAEVALGALGLNASGSTRDAEQINSAIKAHVGSAYRLGQQRKTDFVSRFQHGEDFKEVRQANADASRSVDASLREAQSHRQASEASLTHGRGLRESWDAMRRYQTEHGADFAILLDRHLQARGYSVHDGIADPVSMARELAALAADGTLRADTGGEPLWIPPDASNAHIDEQGLRRLAHSGSAELEAGLHAARKGHADIRAHGREAQSRVQAAQARSGIRPDDTPDRQDLEAKVGAAGDSAVVELHASGTTATASQGRQQVDLDHRAGKLSPYHSPIGSKRDLTTLIDTGGQVMPAGHTSRTCRSRWNDTRQVPPSPVPTVAVCRFRRTTTPVTARPSRWSKVTVSPCWKARCVVAGATGSGGGT